jgi:hypothetical protein
MRGLVAKHLSPSLLLLAALFTLIFAALPSAWYSNLRWVELYWGCPAPIFTIQHNPDGYYFTWWWLWYCFLPLDVGLWAVCFF